MHKDLTTEELFGLSLSDRCGPVRKRILAELREWLGAPQVVREVGIQDLGDGFEETHLPGRTVCLGDYVDDLLGHLLPRCVNMASPGCLGHMTGSVPDFVGPLGEVILALNQNLVKQEASPGFTRLERQTVAMLHRLLYGWPEGFYAAHGQAPASTLGIMAADSTIANVTALWIARNRCFPTAQGFLGVEQEGLAAALNHYGHRSAVVVGSSLMHYSVEKAAGLMGLGAQNVIKIPVDSANRLPPDALREVMADCARTRRRIVAIVGTAGTTDCGSIDPLAELAAIAREHEIHFHVDAAWGTPLLFSPRYRGRVAGIDQADSVTVDGHKQLHLPAGCSALLLRDPLAAKVIEKEAQYMLHKESADLGKRSLEGSRGASALFIHAALNIIGRSGYAALIERNIHLTERLADSLDCRPEFELLAHPETNLLVYRYLPEPWREAARHGTLSEKQNHTVNALNERLQRTQFEAGRSLVSRTTLANTLRGWAFPVVALRAIIINPSTTAADLEAVLEDQARLGEALWLTEREEAQPLAELA